MAKKDRKITADVLDGAADHLASGRALTIVGALVRATVATVGDSPILFHYYEKAAAALKTSARVVVDLHEWNASPEAVIDALRFASIELRFA